MKPLLNTPHFQETTGMSRCGPATLKIVAEYFGMKVSEGKIAKLCGTKKDLGTTGEALAEGARKLGFKSTIKDYATFKDIMLCLKRNVPPIVDWFSPGDLDAFKHQYMPDGHYSAAIGLTKTHIVLEDPEIGGRRNLDRKEFLRVWFDFDTDVLHKPTDILIRRLIIVEPK